MFAVSSRATTEGLETRGVRFVSDTGINLRPVAVAEKEKALREPEPDPRFAELRRQADEAVEMANMALARVHDMERTMGEMPKYRPMLSHIERRICKALGVTSRELRGPGRTRRLTLARWAIEYWTRRLTTMSLPEIGRRIGKDHSSVFHGVHNYPKARAKQGRTLRAVR